MVVRRPRRHCWPWGSLCPTRALDPVPAPRRGVRRPVGDRTRGRWPDSSIGRIACAVGRDGRRAGPAGRRRRVPDAACAGPDRRSPRSPRPATPSTIPRPRAAGSWSSGCLASRRISVHLTTHLEDRLLPRASRRISWCEYLAATTSTPPAGCASKVDEDAATSQIVRAILTARGASRPAASLRPTEPGPSPYAFYGGQGRQRGGPGREFRPAVPGSASRVRAVPRPPAFAAGGRDQFCG
jgi:hypothetical protein